MIIDIHGHPDWCGHDFDKMLKNMAEYNIDKMWMLTWECPAEEFHPVNALKLVPLQR